MYAYHAPSFKDLASNSNFDEFDSFSPAVETSFIVRCQYISHRVEDLILILFEIIFRTLSNW